MAGDWIKIRTDLYEDQKVMKLSDMLGTDDLTTVGLLVRFWSWADKQTSDGTGITLTDERIDRLVGREGFAKALRKVGWLAGRKGSMFLPGFQKHNGSSAKARSLESEAKRLRRTSAESSSETVSDNMSDNMSDSDAEPCPTKDSSFVRPEKRRIEKKKEEREKKSESLSPVPEPPSLEEAESYAFTSPTGITRDCVLKFWNDNEAIGWLHKGQPIRNWRPLLENYARSWNLNEQNHALSRESGPPRHRREITADNFGV